MNKEYIYEELPNLIKEYPLGTIIRNLVKGEKFIVDGYIYDGKIKKWRIVHELYENAWYTPEQFKKYYE